ncbi:MAG: NAD-dependent epimerase/dehydratase family protein [Eubacteriales bacterium]|nr:NAD-dependent epimerase/dehydratase family protein [Eubacteriales bacterium]
MHLLEQKLYQEDVEAAASLDFPWEKLEGKTVLVAGASGMIGSFLIDVLMKKGGCKVCALGRNAERARKRFAPYFGNPQFTFVQGDINEEIRVDAERAEVIFHAASNTHPLAYAADPIGTLTTNLIGTDHLLKFAAEHGNERFLFASSVEIYGENRGDCEKFAENYCGYLDCNTLRAGYPEGKRAGEALCQAYIRQKGLDIVIPRLARTYGPTMLASDSKAIAQFLKKGAAGEDIVLKSEGTQVYSYTYVADAVSGLLACLFYGQCGEAYNIADARSDIALRDLAGMIADYAGKEVVFELPNELERAGYSKATKAMLNGEKLQKLGWKARYDMRSGIERTIQILRETM